MHPIGLPLHADSALRCGTCAWCYRGGRGRAVDRCRQSVAPGHGHGLRVAADAPACVRHEPALDHEACRGCGACCREGFHLVPVGAREPLRRSHPELLVHDTHGAHVPRPGGRCLALWGDGSPRAPFTCSVYGERPRACADFAPGGEACLIARRRVGLSG